MKISLLKNDSLVQCKEQHVFSLENLALFIRASNWSPILFTGGYRKEDNFREAYFLAFDIDEKLTIKETEKRLKGFAYVIAPTRSHQIEKKNKPACDRFRVIIPLARPIGLAKDYRDAIKSFCHQYLPEADSNALDGARFFFASPHEPIINEHGESFKFTRFILPLTVIKFLDEVPSEGSGFNNGLFAAAAELFRVGYEEKEIKSILHPALEYNGWSDYSAEDINAIRSAEKAVQKEKQKQEEDIPWFVRHLSNSEIIFDVTDHENFIIYNKKNHAQLKMDKKAIIKNLGRKEGNEFIRNGRDFFFTYDPFKRDVFLTGVWGEPLFNTYTPPKWLFNWHYYKTPIEPATLPKIYEDFLLFFTDWDRASCEYILDWLAYGLKNQNLTYLCAVGSQGIGKNALGDIITALFGESNSRKVTPHVFKTHFNAALKHKQFIFVDELSLNDDESIDRLKDMVNPKITIEEKGRDSEVVANYANIYLATNRPDGVPFEVGDRRFSFPNLTDVPMVKRADLIEWVKAKAHIDPNNIAALGRYLWHREVKRDMLVPFKSKTTLKVADAQYKHWERYVIELAKNNSGETYTCDYLRNRIQEKFKINPPGNFKFEELAKKCPELMAYKNEAIIVLGELTLPEVQ